MILLTGHRGFIGSAVARRLDALKIPLRRLEGDVRDAASVRRQADGCSAVVHCAFRNVDRGDGFGVNVDGTRVVTDLGLRVAMLSTTGVYGHSPHVLADEDTPIAPDTAFARSRAAADALATDNTVILRHRFVYGPGDAAVLPRLHRAATRSPVWISGGRARLSLVHVDDLAAAMVSAATAPQVAPRVLHVTDGAPVTFRQLAEHLAKRLGGRLPRFSLPFAALYGPVRAWERLRGVDPETSAATVSSIRLRLAGQDQCFAADRIRAAFPDWRPRPLEVGLDDSLSWYRSR